MIKKLRIKLILITMVSVIAVLAIIMGTINISNYATTTNDIDHIIDRLIENGGSFDGFMPQEAERRVNFNNDNSNNPFGPNGMGRETPFETRFFVVTYDMNTDESIVNVQNSSIEEVSALGLALSVFNKERGYKDYYRYRVVTKDNVKTFYFVNAETRLGQFITFLNLSLLISLASIVVVFVFIFLLSKRIIKPISDAYERQRDLLLMLHMN